MLYLLKLAFKNIIREKRRTLLTMAVLAFGVGFFLFVDSYLPDVAKMSTKNLIDFETGHYQVRSADYDPDKPYSVSNFIDNYEEIESVLAGKDYVMGYTERINFLGEADNGVDSIPIIVYGVNPERESTVFTTTNFIEGNILEGGRSFEDGGTVIGKTLADDLGLQVGDWVYITYRTGQGMIGSVELPITGVINSANPQINSSSAFITISEAQKMLNVDSITEIAIRTPDYKTSAKYQKDIENTLPDNQIWSWQELGKNMIEMFNAKTGASKTLIFFIILIGLIGTINTMLLSVYEKQREIGMLKAIGMRDRDVQRMFMMEGMMIGILGSIAGMLFGTLIQIPMIYKGLDFTVLFGNSGINTGFRLMGTLKGSWKLSNYIKAILISIITTTLASYYPARKATKFQAVECLRIVQ